MKTGQVQKQKASKKRRGRRHHIPQRTCVGCRKVQPKRDLVRVVRTPEGAIELDPSGKQAGRGAYLCRQKECWEQALKRRSLERALQVSLDGVAQQALLAYSAELSVQVQAQPKDSSKA